MHRRGLFGRILHRHHDLAVAVGRNSAHGVVCGRKDRHRRFGRVDTDECNAGLPDPGQAFLYHLLAEVIELFPGPYVHVGGDEAPTTR